MNSVINFSLLRNLRLWLLVIAALMLLATFANPRLRLAQNSYRYVFVFDITQSMYVQDAGQSDQPLSRIAQAKAAVRRTISMLPCGSEAAIGIFSQHRSYLLVTPVEICRNFDELMRMLDRIHARMAWRSRSEIAKGIYSAIRMTAELQSDARLVFFTDGHEAPPVNLNLRPSFDVATYEVSGVIVGVGGERPMPIPKFDLNGNPEGYWRAGEVMQIDPFRRGRDTGTERERMLGVDYSNGTAQIEKGREHLSALRQPYLQRLANELALNYQRLDSANALASVLKRSQFMERKPVLTDVRWILAVLALLIVTTVYLFKPISSSIRRLLAHLSS